MASSRSRLLWCGVLLAGWLSTAAQGIVLVDVDPVLPLLSSPMAHGTRMVGQGYLGIDIRDVSDADAASLHLKSTHGAQIIMVDHDGPAGKAGLREHDVVLSVNGTAVDGEEQLRRLLRDLQPGRAVTLVIARNGAEQTLGATMANRAEIEKQAWNGHWTAPEPERDDTVAAVPPKARGGFGSGFMSGHILPSMAPAYTGAVVDALGAQLADYFGVKDGRGLLVHQVDDNSPAATAGLRAGDVITRMNGDRVRSRSDWNRALHDSKGHPVSLTILRDHHEQLLTMVPDAKHRSLTEPPVPAERSWLSVLLLR